jgi:hypothetical protein
MVAMMTLFDGPDTLQGVEQRVTTTTAPQSLLMMNNPVVRSAARSMAQRILPKRGETTADAVKRGYALALGRPPSARELKESVEFIEEQAKEYDKENRTDSASVALADFCQVLFGLNEFVYVD